MLRAQISLPQCSRSITFHVLPSPNATQALSCIHDMSTDRRGSTFAFFRLLAYQKADVSSYFKISGTIHRKRQKSLCYEDYRDRPVLKHQTCILTYILEQKSHVFFADRRNNT